MHGGGPSLRSPVAPPLRHALPISEVVTRVAVDRGKVARSCRCLAPQRPNRQGLLCRQAVRRRDAAHVVQLSASHDGNDLHRVAPARHRHALSVMQRARHRGRQGASSRAARRRSVGVGPVGRQRRPLTRKVLPECASRIRGNPRRSFTSCGPEFVAARWSVQPLHIPYVLRITARCRH